MKLDVLKRDPAMIDQYRGKTLDELEKAGLLEWTVLHRSSQSTNNYAYEELICERIEYNSNVSLVSYYRNNQALMKILMDDWSRHSSWGDLQSTDLDNTVMLRTASRTAGDGTVYEVRAAIGGNPLRVAMKKLFLVYILTLAVVVGVIVLYGMLLEQRLEKPLGQIIDSGRKNMTPIHAPYWGMWEDIILVQQSYIHAQQVLQNLRQENIQLKTALDYAENAESNRRQMVSNITHELKTPLSVIHSYCEGLQAGIAPEKQDRYLKIIAEEVDRIDAMVLEMLDLSRLEAGKVRLSQDSVELLSLTQGILSKFQPLLDAKKLSVYFVTAEKSTLIADEGRLKQVITNLTTNAIKYSPEGGKVVINVFQRNGFTFFSIENQSPPLSQEALEKVWESFYRTEQSRTSKGTGLGLSICKAIIDLHRGSCQVKNTFSGVEFSFMLPG